MTGDLAGCRVLLVNASHYRPKRIYSEYPLGLGYVGTALLNAGAQVKVLDLALDATPLSEAISTFEPTMIGFSFLSTSWPSARQEVKKIRDSYDGYIMAGGIHATLFPDQFCEQALTSSCAAKVKTSWWTWSSISAQPLLAKMEQATWKPFQGSRFCTTAFCAGIQRQGPSLTWIIYPSLIETFTTCLSILITRS